MLGDVPRYARHVRWFPCEGIAIATYEVDELAFLFGWELGPYPHRLGWVSGVDPHCLSFLEWAEGRRGSWLVIVRDCWVNNSPSRGSLEELMTVVVSS